MKKQLEVYLRPSAKRALLMFHMPESTKNAFFTALERGEVAIDDLKMNFELSILPEWITDPVERVRYERSGCLAHIRVPLSAITASYSDENE
jgi:hypothetical protein